MSKELKSCPFCSGKARVSLRQLKYIGQNELGCRKIKFATQVICNKCKARGGVATKVIITDRVDTYDNVWALKQEAIEAWNRR